MQQKPEAAAHMEGKSSSGDAPPRAPSAPLSFLMRRLTPLTMLGGVFYSVELLGEPWRTVSYCNPILYMVNAFRHSILGSSDLPISVAGGVLGLFIVGFYTVAIIMLRRGVGIRS